MYITVLVPPLILINYHSYSKFEIVQKNKFNYLIIIRLCCDIIYHTYFVLVPPLIVINYHLSSNFEIVQKNKFNYLIIIRLCCDIPYLPSEI